MTTPRQFFFQIRSASVIESITAHTLAEAKPGSQPLTWITRAESKRHAIGYAQARWPGAAVEVA